MVRKTRCMILGELEDYDSKLLRLILINICVPND